MPTPMIAPLTSSRRQESTPRVTMKSAKPEVAIAATIEAKVVHGS